LGRRRRGALVFVVAGGGAAAAAAAAAGGAQRRLGLLGGAAASSARRGRALLPRRGDCPRRGALVLGRGLRLRSSRRRASSSAFMRASSASRSSAPAARGGRRRRSPGAAAGGRGAAGGAERAAARARRRRAPGGFLDLGRFGLAGRPRMRRFFTSTTTVFERPWLKLCFTLPVSTVRFRPSGARAPSFGLSVVSLIKSFVHIHSRRTRRPPHAALSPASRSDKSAPPLERVTHTRGGSPVDQRDMYHILPPKRQ
jgi:hypothetical protein